MFLKTKQIANSQFNIDEPLVIRQLIGLENYGTPTPAIFFGDRRNRF